MNQTQKRLNIIKLAISITDMETIQLQILKLTPMKSDSKIQKILTLLQAESYAQAQALITEYIETAPEQIHQRSAQVPLSPAISQEDQAIIDEFQLFVVPQENITNEINEIDMNDFVAQEPKITKNTDSVDYDSLLNLDVNDVLSDNIDIDISYQKTQKNDEDVLSTAQTKEESVDFILDDCVPKDTFFDEEPHKDSQDNRDKLDSKEKTTIFKDTFQINTPEQKKDVVVEDIVPISENIIKTDSLSYKAIPHIAQKLISMKKQYPPIQKNYEIFDTVEALINKISQEGYTESEMEDMIFLIEKLIEQAKYTEASQLLLVCGATQSQYAQFILARELYKGSVLTKNIQESFTLMHILATNDYPEALCDLGQFYENGIGTSQDLIKAERLYKDALDLGIKRAKKHYIRLRKHNRGLFKS